MGCIKFSGTENCYIQAKVDSIPYANNPRTIECAFKTTTTKEAVTIWGYGSTAAGTPLLFVCLRNGKIYFETGSGSNKYISTESYNDDKWHTIKVVITGTQIKLYVDKVLVHNVTATINTAKSDFYIGKYFGVSGWAYEGYIDEVRIWDKELSEDEMFTTYDKKLTGNEPNLILNYSFESDNIKTIEDKTGNYNGTGYNLTYIKNDDIYPCGFLVKKDNQYYSIKEEYYDSTSKNFKAISNLTLDNFNNYSFIIYDLFKEVTIDGETFIPFDKFDDFYLISNVAFAVNINGIKSNTSMIATIEPISMKKFETIHKITGIYNITNGAIKLIFSFDKGSTWKTYDVTNSKWNTVSVNIPIKLYENFTDEDKTNWNDATNTILSDGISVQNLGNVDFQSIKTDKLMFAVAFNRPSYADTCTLKGLNINYDGLTTYIQLAVGSDLSKYEAKATITGDTVGVTTSSNQDKILVTMTTNI